MKHFTDKGDLYSLHDATDDNGSVISEAFIESAELRISNPDSEAAAVFWAQLLAEKSDGFFTAHELLSAFIA